MTFFRLPLNKFAATALAFLMAGPSHGAVVPLGVVTHAEHAKMGTAAASVGSTVYDGDSVSTEPGGTILVTAGAVTMELAPQSSVTMRQGDGGVMVELVAGGLVFSAGRNSGIAVLADDASIRPAGNEAVVTYVRIIDKKELRICAQRGAVELSYRGESEKIPEGKMVKVRLDPSEKEIAAASASEDSKNPGKAHHTFLLIVIAVSLLITIPTVIHALESPDRPGPR